MAALQYWVWLTNVPGLTNHSRWLLLEHFHAVDEIYYADEQQILLTPGITVQQAQLLREKSLDRAEEILAECARKDIFLVTVQDALYPARLRQIYDAPLLLYGKGAMPLFDDEAAIAVVGTRKNTPYGVHCAEQLGYEMAKQGALIVSGLAMGIDAAAHAGALRAGGFAVAVLGCGVDVVYPKSSSRLYEDIAATGVLLSEYPPGTAPDPWRFPARNRIISGLSLATVVVEAPEGSGALITAELAGEQGRDVFAVPGPLGVKESVGCNQLIRDGAGLVSCGWDVLQQYQGRFPHRLRREAAKLPPKPEGGVQKKKEATPMPEQPKLPALDVDRNREGLTDDQIRVLRILDARQGKLSDEVAEETMLPMRRVLSALTVLEIDGYARQEGARRFVRTVEIKEKKEG